MLQNVSGETFDAVAVRKSLSKHSDFQSVTASAYLVFHQAQGDKQEINPIQLKSSLKTNGNRQRNDAPPPRKRGLYWFFSFSPDTGPPASLSPIKNQKNMGFVLNSQNYSYLCRRILCESNNRTDAQDSSYIQSNHLHND